MAIEKLSKLMIDATVRGYYQADDADPDEAVTPYAKARAREDALLEALKDVLSSSISVEYSYPQARDVIRQIEVTR